MANEQYNITVSHATSGKELVLEVSSDFSVSSVLDVLVESLKLKDRFVLANSQNKILDSNLTLKEAGIFANSKLIFMPDPTGGLN